MRYTNNMRHLRIGIAALIVTLLLAALIGGYALRQPQALPAPAAGTAVTLASSTSDAGSAAVSLTKEYRNSTYFFSLRMPADYTASEMPQPQGGGETIVLQNGKGDGIQIDVSIFDEDTSGSYTLTEARIRKDLPNIVMQDVQPVEIGPAYTGLAFIGYNPSFGGQSREVWFVYHGEFYQISTYTRLDPLMQAIFATWRFY